MSGWLGAAGGVLLLAFLLRQVKKVSQSASSALKGEEPDRMEGSPPANVWPELPGRPRAVPLLNGGEQELLAHLMRLTAGRAIFIAPKVRVLDVTGSDNPLMEPEERDYAFRAHFDFVLLYRPTMTPILAVELDGEHHRSDPKTQQRDALKDSICRRIGLPLMRVRPGRWGDLLPVEQALERYFAAPSSADLYQR